MIDNTKIPDFTRVIVEEYLSLLLPYVEYDFLVLAVQYLVSKIICTNRCYITSNKVDAGNTCPNIYIMSLADSGSGKDRTLKQLQKLLKDFYIEFNEKSKKIKLTKEEEIEEEIKKRKYTKAAAQQYRRDNLPRPLYHTLKSGSTVEGAYAMRYSLQEAKYGCSCWEDSEIYDTMGFFKSQKSTIMEFISYMKDSFDHGDGEPKTTKSERSYQPIRGVPSLMLVHGAIDEDGDKDLFKTFFDLGFARRVFLIMQDTPPKLIDPSQRMELSEKAMKNKEYCLNLIYEIVINKTNCDYIKTELKLTSKAETLYGEYEYEYEKMAREICGYGTKGLKAEIRGRVWRILKLSGVLAVQNNEKNNNIIKVTGKDMEQAKYMVDFFGDHFRKFYNLEEYPLEQKIYEYISKNPGITRTLLTQSKIIMGKYEQRKNVIYTLINRGALQEYLDSIGKILIIKMDGKTKKSETYFIETIPEHQEYLKNYEIKMSQGCTNEVNDTTLDDVVVKFEELHEIIETEVNYCPSRFKDSQRSNKNWLQGNNLIVIDVDNDVEYKKQLTIKQVKERLKDYTFLIMTTRNHNKDKKEKGRRERFRILIPTTEIKDIDHKEYSEIMTRVLRYFGFDYKDEGGKSWVDIPALKNPSQAYHGNKSEPIYNWGLLFNWRTLKKEFIEDKFKYKTGTKFKNEFPKSQILKVKGQDLNCHEYLYIAKIKQPKTTPCICPFHPDNNPSAHFSINNNGHFMFCCSVCGEPKYCDQ